MKIAYCIYVGGHGRGGHTYSLLETATQVGKEVETIVVSIGVRRSPVLAGFKGKYYHLEDQGIIKTAKAFSDLVGGENVSVIHAFDVKAFIYARIVSRRSKIPLVLTKCGGPNPNNYYPYHSHIVLFSQENKTFFAQKRKFKNTAFPVIANRVEMDIESQDAVRIAELKQKLEPNVPVILRINRIGPAYSKSIEQGINLVEKLTESGVFAQLLVIGVVEDQSVFNMLCRADNKYIKFVTDDRYTVNASQLIGVADLVIGTGRGFMEAALMGKIMLSPTGNLSLPVLATRERVSSIFSKNFSPRYEAEVSNEEAFDEIRSILESRHNARVADISCFANEHFSSKQLYSKYKAVYDSAEPARLDVFDILIHWFYYSGIVTRIKKKFKEIRKVSRI